MTVGPARLDGDAALALHLQRVEVLRAAALGISLGGQLSGSCQAGAP